MKPLLTPLDHPCSRCQLWRASWRVGRQHLVHVAGCVDGAAQGREGSAAEARRGRVEKARARAIVDPPLLFS